MKNIGILGFGQMGKGIALAFLACDYSVFVYDTKLNYIEDMKFIFNKLKKLNKEDNLKHLIIKTELKDFSESNLIIEAISENLIEKQNVISNISQYCNDKTIFVSNTSSISITELAKSYRYPENFMGMHFMNPANIMPLIEGIIGDKTSEFTLNVVKEYANSLNKTLVCLKDSPGFIVNRLLFTLINEAINLLSENITTKEDIDLAMKLGCNFPMGPLTLADFIGLDTCLEILKILYNDLGEKFKPNYLLEEYVLNGKLGKKTGEGFYKYGEKK